MKQVKKRFALLIIIVLGLCVACQDDVNPINNINSEWNEAFNDTTLVGIVEELSPNLTIEEGVVSQHEEIIRIVRDGATEAVVVLGEPIIVSQANREEDWGFFQFPIVFRDASGNLIVSWQMNEDSYTAYGKEASGRMMSFDEGLTWSEPDKENFPRKRNRVDFKNGDFLQVHNSIAKNISQYKNFPSPVYSDTINGYGFYNESEIPEDLRGVYFEFWNNSIQDTVVFHGLLNDPGLLRYSIDDYIPIVWWGDIKETLEGELVAGVYGGSYLNSEGKPLRSSVTFYHSDDLGHLWNRLGIIPFQQSIEEDFNSFVFDGTDGFTEPTFEVLRDGKLLCVMRSGNRTPMYKTISRDNGVHWTAPEPFTPNGVMPRLMLLKNGVLVLASGRPGLQLRFCLNGDGNIWTEPIEMMPYIYKNGSIDIWATNCGYSCILEADKNSFYIVYSDFTANDSRGEQRKTILFRKINLILRSDN